MTVWVAVTAGALFVASATTAGITLDWTIPVYAIGMAALGLGVRILTNYARDQRARDRLQQQRHVENVARFAIIETQLRGMANLDARLDALQKQVLTFVDIMLDSRKDKP